jgi:hypothetical protein
LWQVGGRRGDAFTLAFASFRAHRLHFGLLSRSRASRRRDGEVVAAADGAVADIVEIEEMKW